MSAAVSPVSPVSNTAPLYYPHEVTPIPKPTLSEQTQELASTGLSVLEISTTLAIPTAQVTANLGISTSDAVSTEPGAPAGLSIHI